MRKLFHYVLLSYFSLVSCSPRLIVNLNEFREVGLKENTTFRISKPIDLKGEIVTIPKNCTLFFTRGGSISNGEIKGDSTIIRYSSPFLGNNVIFNDCSIGGKSLVKDSEVFLKVTHNQYEIQTLFDISGGKRIEFSPGIYNDIEKIEINNNVDAYFNNSEIRLKWGSNYVAECFYMEPWINKGIQFVKINDLKITGKRNGISNASVSRRCIQLFYVSEVVLNHVIINQYYGGPYEYDEDARDLLNKTRLGTCAIAIMKYDKCLITKCSTRDIYSEVFWCVPNNNPDNITYFTNNVSTSTAHTGSASFFTILDGRCVIKNNIVYNYNGSALNALCYDSEICNNSFYDGKRSVAIDLSEGTMYMARNVSIHDNECFNTKGLIAGYGLDIRIEKNKWRNRTAQIANGCQIVIISSRGERSDNGRYIGCDNNPEFEVGSKRIIIKNNCFECDNSDNTVEILGAYLKGEDISYTSNTMIGLNVPVVKFMEGERFVYKGNIIKRSSPGNYAELVIDKCHDIEISNNTFSRNNTVSNLNCTVQVRIAEGHLTFQRNRVRARFGGVPNDGTYIPCYIKDYSKLNSAEIFIRRADLKKHNSLGIDSHRIPVRTNIRTN